MSSLGNLVPTPPQSLSQRKRIGASTAAAAIGISPYARPIDVWLELTGRKQRDNTDTGPSYWGRVLEPVIRAQYVERNSVTVHVPPDSLFHVELPFVSATPDGIVLDGNNKWLHVGPQCKNVGLRAAPQWEEGPPDHYRVQAVIEMAVTNLPRLDFAVLMGGQDYREFTVTRDRKLEDDILEALTVFWGYVENDIEPPVDDSPSFASHLASKISRSNVIVKADSLSDGYVMEWLNAQRQIDALEENVARIKNNLLEFLANHNADTLQSSSGIVKLGAGRVTTSWKDVIEELIEDKLVSREVVNAVSDRHKNTGSRPLNRPREWSAK